MVVWITLLAVAVMAAVLWLLRPRRPVEQPRAHSDVPVEPVEVGATIRSYVIPKRWLRDAPAKGERAGGEAEALPRYASAIVERVNEAGATTGSWDLLRGRTRLGRDADNYIALDDERVSLHHALITVRDGVYWLEDLGSTNGTFIGEEKRVMAAHPLVDGEELRLGGVVLVFRGTPGQL